jgi:hypothetical protein
MIEKIPFLGYLHIWEYFLMIGQPHLAKATPLEKANVVLEKVIDYAQGSKTFLSAVGIFRQSGDSTIVDGMYSKVDADPALLQLENEKQFSVIEHNVTGLLKRFILDDKMQWSDEAAAILHKELNEKLDDRTFEFDFKSVIEKLIEKDQLEEAKMLHNILYMAYLVSQKSETNKMPSHNMFQTYAPWLAGMSKANDGLFMMLTLAAKPVTLQNLDALGLYKEGAPVYSKTFDQTYPKPAEKIAKEHANITSRVDRQPKAAPETSVKATSDETVTSTKLELAIKGLTDWLKQKAIPAIINFFTKKIPGWIRQFTGAKEKSVNPPPTLPIDKIVDVPPTKPAWQRGDTPTLQRNPNIVMGSQVRGPLPSEPPQESPPPAPVQSEVKEVEGVEPQKEAVRPPIIIPTKITQEEKSAMQKAKSEALAFFKDLEKKVEKKVSDFRPKN